MTKGGAVLLVISILLVGSVSFVSAGLLDDVWNQITGKVVEENVTSEPELEPPIEESPEKECKGGKIKYYTCEDGTKIPECECENEEWICKISVKDCIYKAIS